MHKVPNKTKGGLRHTRITDARKMNLFPSVTTILKLEHKEALVNWLVNQAYLQAMTTPAKPGESIDDYIKRCKQAERDDLDKMAKKGGDIHNAIEHLFKGHRVVGPHRDTALAVQNLVFELTGKTRGFIAEKRFSSPAGYGGMIDLHHLDGDGFIIDYKSKDFTEETADKRMHWNDQLMQLSAYARGIQRPMATLINIYVSRQVPGLVRHHVWSQEDSDRAYAEFECLLELWKLRNNHRPSKA
jgi:hypothetical protein